MVFIMASGLTADLRPEMNVLNFGHGAFIGRRALPVAARRFMAFAMAPWMTAEFPLVLNLGAIGAPACWRAMAWSGALSWGFERVIVACPVYGQHFAPDPGDGPAGTLDRGRASFFLRSWWGARTRSTRTPCSAARARPRCAGRVFFPCWAMWPTRSTACCVLNLALPVFAPPSRPELSTARRPRAG